MRQVHVTSSPSRDAGDSTAWYASFRSFCAAYLRARFGLEWGLSPEQSLALHAGNRVVPKQLLVRAPKGRNQVTPLPHGTSLLEVRAAIPDAGDVPELDGMRAFSLSAARVACPARFFHLNPVDARTAPALMHGPSDLLRRLLDGGHSTVGGRLPVDHHAGRTAGRLHDGPRRRERARRDRPARRPPRRTRATGWLKTNRFPVGLGPAPGHPAAPGRRPADGARALGAIMAP